MQNLLNSAKHHDLLRNDYAIDDRWFQQQMGEVDVLRARMFEEIKGKTVWIRSAWYKTISYIKLNRAP